jgi:hypothetical protein
MCAFEVTGMKNMARLTMTTALGLGISTTLLTATHLNLISAPAVASSEPTEAAQLTQVANITPRLADGVYVYGQTTQPDQFGQSYFVFEVKQGRVLGALYMPGSSFDCAYGRFQREQLALSVRDSYDHTASPFAIALDRRAQVATTNLNGIGQVGLEGFQKLAKVSQNDMRMLNTCKATYQAKAW